MTEQEKIDIFRKINFGAIDANADPDLESYFIDDDYWEKIIESPVFYVIGKKGTGKSALYRMFEKYAMDRGALISNSDFGDFPINNLANLSDDEFAKPNQYQSIWQQVILNIFTGLIVKSETADRRNRHFKEIQQYYDLRLGNASDLLRQSINTVRKNEHSLEVVHAGITPRIATESELSANYVLDSSNISEINSRLLKIITEYFKTCNDASYIIQFDRLDDTYNQATDIETYYQIIISLMKAVYKINCQFRVSGIDNVKVIVYLRTDIIDELGKRDSESARWDDFTFNLNWAIVNKNDWKNSLLQRMIDKRISVSLHKNISIIQLLDSSTIRIQRKAYSTEQFKDVFKYIIDHTMHRPRDLIQFCKCIQKELRKPQCRVIDYRRIKDAEKVFCFWLVNQELANEINPIVHDTKNLYSFLKELGNSTFSFEDFQTKYNNTPSLVAVSTADQMVEYLYDIGILTNVYSTYVPNRHRHVMQFKSKIRNPGPVDKKMKLQIHPGVWKGIMQ